VGDFITLALSEDLLTHENATLLDTHGGKRSGLRLAIPISTDDRRQRL
jgi:hypothetical protein